MNHPLQVDCGADGVGIEEFLLIEEFGYLPNGETVYRVGLNNNGMQSKVLTFGATLQDLRIPDRDLALVLGFENFEPYLKELGYFGAIVGRVANRISRGQFKLEGREYQIDKNLEGMHTLHGGFNNIGLRNWRISDQGDDFVLLEILDPDGQAGFPGNCRITCRYTLDKNQGINIKLTATSDQTTLCNLAHHSYFNLDGRRSILDHHLQINAPHYLPVDGDLIPTGEKALVEGTRFDFLSTRPVKPANGAADYFQYDHNFCLSNAVKPIREVAKLSSKVSDIEMGILTDQPGLQVYTGGHINTEDRGLFGQVYGTNAGIAFEPQFWPDAPNQPDFPSIILPEGETYRQNSCFRFSKIQAQ